MSSRVIILLFVYFLGLPHSYASNYYFSDTDGNDSRSPLEAQNPTTPWKSLRQLNAFFPRLKPGDSVLFKRGDIFPGKLALNVSGSIDHPIVLSAYGQGNKPQITGLTALSNWRPSKEGVWTSACKNCGPSVNVLIINDSVQPMGRYPNTSGDLSGYRTISSHFKNSSITDSTDLNNTDWTGAEVVIRKNRYIIDRSRVLQSQGRTISYQGGSFYEPTNGFGYFIQNHPATLDQNGEWFFDPAEKKMMLYFSAGNPSGQRINVSVQDTLVKCNKVEYVVLDNLSFLGANSVAIFIANSNNLVVSGCDIRYSGTNAFVINRSNHITLDQNNIQDSYNDAVMLLGFQNRISNNKILNTGVMPGMGGNENSYNAISIEGDQNDVYGNTIENTGYIPILFQGNEIVVRNNFINRFTMLKDDGGGIYTWSGKLAPNAVQTGRKIEANLVMNGMNALAGTNGTPSIVAGIYLDDNAGDVTVNENTVSDCSMGLYLHNAHDISAGGNVLTGNGIQLYVKQDQAKFEMKNNQIRQNYFASTTGAQKLVQFYTTSQPVKECVELDSNQYICPASFKTPFATYSRTGKGSFTNYNSENWKGNFGFDKHSKWSDCSTARIEMNPTNREKRVPLDGQFFDATNKSYNSELILPAFRSIVLFKKKQE